MSDEIKPGYGFVLCEHDDPKRSHYFDVRWNDHPCPEGKRCPTCAKAKHRKPVEIPVGWELVPESEFPKNGNRAWDASTSDWDNVWFDFKVDCAGKAGVYSAFIRRKQEPVNKCAEPSIDSLAETAWSKHASEWYPNYNDQRAGFIAGFKAAKEGK